MLFYTNVIFGTLTLKVTQCPIYRKHIL